MARTFNRTPLSVGTPDDKDIKNYFFNHYNWKGIIDDKNFLGVDQESFSDTNNVYIDSEGLLRSRPSLKIKVVEPKTTINETTYTYHLEDIINCWRIGNTIVYESIDDNIYHLTFVNSDFEENSVQVTIADEKCKLITADEKIYIFTPSAINYYDMIENKYYDGLVSGYENPIYIPITSVVANGVVTKNESPNILTSTYITRYLYDNLKSLDVRNLLGKTVTITTNGKEYTVTFVNNNQLVFVGKYTGLNENAYVHTKTDTAESNEYCLGKGAEGYPFVAVSSVESMLISTCTYTLDINKVPSINWQINHTVDGKVFTPISTSGLGTILGKPCISKDGNYAIVFCQEGPYIINVIDTATSKYETWTNLLNALDSTTYTSWALNMNTKNTTGELYNQTQVVNGYFLDAKNFAFTYGTYCRLLSGTDPSYRTLFMIYAVDGNIYRKAIFAEAQTDSTSYVYNPDGTAITNTYRTNPISDAYSLIYNNSQSDVDINYTTSSSETAAADLTNRLLSIVYNKYTQQWSIQVRGNFTFKPTKGDTIEYSFNEIKQNVDTPPTDGTTKTIIFNLPYFNINVYYRSEDGILIRTITVIPKSITTSTGGASSDVTINGKYYYTVGYMPNVYCRTDASNNFVAIVSLIAKPTTELKYNRIFYRLARSSSEVSVNEAVIGPLEDNLISPIKEGLFTDGLVDLYSYYRFDNTNKYLYVNSYTYNSYTATTNTNYSTNIKTLSLSANDTVQYSYCKFAYPNKYLATEHGVYLYSIYNTESEYNYIPLLFKSKVIDWYYEGNTYDSIYLADDNNLFVNELESAITIDEVTQGTNNYFVPDYYAELSEYYFSNSKDLYISAQGQTVAIDEFKWYFPERNTQTFDYKITNLHTISANEVAVFLEDSIHYVSRETNESTILYRYYKSKIQVGCLSGSDVLTTFDGKYVLFTSKRGLVAMTYQEFIASDEQTLSYLSDPIYQLYYEYIKANNDSAIKLYKYGYWIITYKQSCNYAYVLDTRNNSWWRIESTYNAIKFIDIDNEVKYLSNGKLFDLNKSDDEYYDFYNPEEFKINWHITSQKLYLKAINYYKHIVNMTFVSVHSKVDDEYMDYQLRCNIYRKYIDGNISNKNEYETIEYNVNGARTFVQRLNYSKVNEFEYKLSNDSENNIELDLPLSINGITVKYKIGGQVR